MSAIKTHIENYAYSNLMSFEEAMNDPKCLPKLSLIPGEAYQHKDTKTIAVCSVADNDYALFWLVLNGQFCISERMPIAECNDVLTPYNPLLQGKLK